MSVQAQLLQSCPILCDPMYHSPPGSSVHGISQARILEWVAISSSKRSFGSRDQTYVSCFAGGLFTTEPPGKPHTVWVWLNLPSDPPVTWGCAILGKEQSFLWASVFICKSEANTISPQGQGRQPPRRVANSRQGCGHCWQTYHQVLRARPCPPRRGWVESVVVFHPSHYLWFSLGWWKLYEGKKKKKTTEQFRSNIVILFWVTEKAGQEKWQLQG